MPEFREQLEAAGGGRDILISTENSEIEKYLDQIEIGMGDIPYTLIPRMMSFKWWQLWSAGADILQRLPLLIDLPFQLTTSRGIHGQQIAEHLFAMLLGWNRRLKEAYKAQARHEWLFLRDDELGGALDGKTMLILGYGVIGEFVAKIALAFNMKVTGLRRHTGKGGQMEGLFLDAAAKMHEHLPLADYVVNILPSTHESKHLFGAGEFSLMKKSALYINVGRGATTCEASMIKALGEKSIAGALLDVTEAEPLPASSPLWDMENVMITGHYAGCHPDYSRMAMAVALENLARYTRGEELKNLVNKRDGY